MADLSPELLDVVAMLRERGEFHQAMGRRAPSKLVMGEHFEASSALFEAAEAIETGKHVGAHARAQKSAPTDGERRDE